MTTILPLGLAVAFTSIAQVLFKLYFRTRQLAVLVTTVVVFCLAPVMSYLALQHASLSTVYMATGLTYVIVVALAALVLDESLDRRRMYATLLIVGGVIVFNLNL